MAKLTNQYQSITLEFRTPDYGYFKMGRCVTYVRPKSEAERLGVKVGWLEKSESQAKRLDEKGGTLEESAKRATLSNYKKRRRWKSKSKSCKTLVHFLLPKRPSFCKVICRALASTHHGINHPQRKIVGTVALGTVLLVMDIEKNRALVACPKSGWNPDKSRWLPKQQFAWLSIQAKDGTQILENLCESRLYTSIRSSSSTRSSTKRATTCPPMGFSCMNGRLSVIPQTEPPRSARKRVIHPDFQKKQNTSFSYLSPSRMRLDRSPTSKHSTVSSYKSKPKHSPRDFIDLEFEETKNNSVPQTLIPLNFKVETALSDDLESFMTSSVSGTNSKVSLTRSKTLIDSYIPEVQTDHQPVNELGNSNYLEKPASVSDSDAKLKSKRDMLGLPRPSNEEIQSECGNEKKESLENNLSVMIPDSKMQSEEIDSRGERISLTESKLTPISFESKYTSKSSEVSYRRYATPEVKWSTPEQKMEERQRLAQCYESPMSSSWREHDRSPIGRNVRYCRGENVDQQGRPSERVFEPTSVKKHRAKKYDGEKTSVNFSSNIAQKPQTIGKMNAPFRINVEREGGETYGRIIRRADI